MKQAVTYFLVAASGGSSYVTSEQGRGRERDRVVKKSFAVRVLRAAGWIDV